MNVIYEVTKIRVVPDELYWAREYSMRYSQIKPSQPQISCQTNIHQNQSQVAKPKLEKLGVGGE